jgi:hypothetical protein
MSGMHVIARSALSAGVALLFVTTASAGVWEDELTVTQDPIFQSRSCIATAPDDAVYVLYPDWTDWENTQVLIKSSTDHGHTWSEPATLASGTAYDNVGLAVDETGGVHVLLVEFYEDDEGEYKLLYHMKSTDGGETFTEPARVGDRPNIESLRIFTMPGHLCIYGQNADWDLEQDFNYTLRER